MSAWLCSENHLNILANIPGQFDKLTAFVLLLDANIASLEARYPGRDFLEEWKQKAKGFKFRDESPQYLTAVAMGRAVGYGEFATIAIKLCHCFDYQACEVNDYNGTDAAMITRGIVETMTASGGKSEGKAYDAAPWGID